MLRRCFEDTVSALTYSLIREHRGPEFSPLHNEVVRFVLEQHARVPDYLRVPLSSVDHSTAELGRIAGEMALDLAAKPDQPPRSVLLEPKLVIRQSSST